MFAKWSLPLKVALLGIGVLVIGLGPGVNLWVEDLWFQVTGYGSVFQLRLLAQGLLGLLGFLVAGLLAGGNVLWAWRRETEPATSVPPDSRERRRVRTSDQIVTSARLSRSAASPQPRPSRAIETDRLRQYGRDWSLLGVGGLTVLLAVDLARAWLLVLAWLHQQPFGSTDPVFGRDLSFYVFTLPVLQRLQSWGFNLVALTLLAVALVYCYRRGALGSGSSFQGFQPADRRHWMGLMGVLLLLVSLGHWLRRYELLNSERGVVFGAGYADLNAALPAQSFLAGVALVGGGLLLALAWRGGRLDGWKTLTSLGLGYGLLLFGLGLVYPAAVQRLVVQPTELAREQPYLERNIAFTRQAFGLGQIAEKPYEVKFDLTRADLTANAATLNNIRLWDNRPLLDAYSQLQEIRLYYSFAGVDVDRYRIGSETRQVILAARELDYEQVPPRAQTWVNQNFLYTHGYGLVLSPVNAVTAEGQPDFFIQDIPPRATSASVAASLPVRVPGIYYGELSRQPVFVRTKAQELDYPEGDQNVYTRYNGAPGLAVGHFWQRLLYAWYFRDPRILLTQNFTPDSQILFRRTIRERAATLVPFLHYDSDPYLVVLDGRLHWLLDAYTTSDHYPYSEPIRSSAARALPSRTANSADADAEPPVDPQQQAEQHPEYRDPLVDLGDLNYIRNSVKVVIDAYNGTVGYYIADPDDPLVQTYAAAFPGLFQPLSALPAGLEAHLRYPTSLFAAQSRLYATYHMRDPQVFYNKEDQWQIPLELLGSQPILVPPHYFFMKLPGEQREEFILMTPFTPTRKDNMIAWLAARSDGEQYGKLLAFQFSKQELIYGPRQIEARIDQDPVISQQITLWSQRGSQVYRGNVLVIPINSSILYVEPLYLQAEQSRLPELRRVIVAYEDQIVMSPTLEESLRLVFGTAETTATPASLTPPGLSLPLPGTTDNPLAGDLVQQALRQWEAAQQALVRGNQNDYGRLQRELYETLRELEQQVGPSGSR